MRKNFSFQIDNNVKRETTISKNFKRKRSIIQTKGNS